MFKVNDEVIFVSQPSYSLYYHRVGTVIEVREEEGEEKYVIDFKTKFIDHLIVKAEHIKPIDVFNKEQDEYDAIEKTVVLTNSEINILRNSASFSCRVGYKSKDGKDILITALNKLKKALDE